MTDSYALYTEKLTGEYKEVFKQVEMYVTTEYLDELTREEQMSQLLDIFLSAQEAGKPVEKIVGKDLESFCKTFCSGYGWKSRALYMLDALKIPAWLTAIFVSIDIVLQLIDPDFSGSVWDRIRCALTYPIDFGFLIGFVIAAAAGLVSFIVVRWAMFRCKKISMPVLQFVTAVIAAISFFAILLLLASDEVSMISCPAWIQLLVSAAYLVLYYRLNRRRFAEKKAKKVRFRDMVSEEMDKAFPEEMEKKYQKANEKHIKKGKGELPLVDFLGKEEKACASAEKSKWYYFTLPLVIIAIFVLFGEFESTLDLVIYIAIMLGIEYAIMPQFWKFEKKGIAMRRAWIKVKRAELEDPQ